MRLSLERTSLLAAAILVLCVAFDLLAGQDKPGLLDSLTLTPRPPTSASSPGQALVVGEKHAVMLVGGCDDERVWQPQ